ncbi:hypothetical protein WK59_13260 [Burkholderia ubonensis]|nr:hypothetical protein WI84_26065 [Burkholderia ubonensis]KVT84424.1 hypothetical protein WK59_13260 [Burkholderia ubonensis]
MSAGVHAQSNVVLFGAVDDSIQYIEGVQNSAGQTSHKLSLQSGRYAASVWGLNATEDLGGGTSAIVNLKGSFNTNTGVAAFGEPGVLFNYKALVGLTNDKWGTFKVGRTFALDNGVWDFDPFVQQNWSSASLVEGRNWNTTINTLNYWSPVWNGFDVYFQYGLGNQPSFNKGAPGQFGRTDGVQLTYTSPWFQVRGIYDEMRSANGTYSDLYLYSKEAIAMANVFLGPFKLQGAFTHLWADAAAPGAPTAADYEWLGLTYQWSPALALSSAVYRIDANGRAALGGGHATMVVLGGTYNLSKRTMLYATGGLVRNGGSAQFSLSPNGVGSSDNPLPGHRQIGMYAGIRHSF